MSKYTSLAAAVTAAVVLAGPAGAEEEDVRAAGHASLRTEAQKDIEEIVVTATPLRDSPWELAQSAVVLRGAELRRIQSSNIGETLAAQPGISASYFGAGSSRPIIRGLGGQRVRVTQDAIDALDVSTVSVDHAVSVDPLVADQVEVLRGPTTLLYGSGAVGGVVNTVTNRIPNYVPDSKLEGAFELRGDSVSDERSAVVRLDGGADGFAWHVDGVRRATSDYEIPGFAEVDPEPGTMPGGTLFNSDYETTTGAIGGSYVADWGYVGISFSGFETEYGVPTEEEEEGEEPGGGEDEGEEAIRIDLEQRRVDLAGAYERFRFRLAFNDYEHRELEGAETGTVFENDAWEGRVEYLHSPWGQWQGALGVQFGNREFSAIGAEAFVPPVDAASLGVFLVEKREFDKVELSVGARVEREEKDPSGDLPDVDDTAVSLGAGGVWAFSDAYRLGLNLANAERLPTPEELFSDGPHLATGTFEIGDPELVEETSRHADLFVRKVAGNVTFGLTVFHTRFDDFIFLRETGGVEDGLPVFEWSQRDAEFTGAELEATLPLMRGGEAELDLQLNADYVEGEFDGGGNVPRLPPLRRGARLEYRSSNLVAGLEGRRYSAQTDVAAFETPTAGYTMYNFDVSVTVPGDGLDLNVFLRGTNLLDEDARRHTSFVKDRTPLPGRNLILGIRGAF